MEANIASEETELIDKAVALLAERLPQNWEVTRSKRHIVAQGAPQNVDGLIDLRSPNGAATLVVEAKKSFAPRDAKRLFPEFAQVLRTIANQPVLVVAPWLSRRTQELLEREGVNFLDLTGN